jgi:multidrug resistance efflux pump
MDYLIEALKSHFTWGLLLGLLIAFFIWKSAFSHRRRDAREIKRLEAEMKDLQGHLNTQLKINASGNESLQSELEAEVAQISAAYDTSNLKLETENLKPRRTDVKVEEVALLWMPSGVS